MKNKAVVVVIAVVVIVLGIIFIKNTFVHSKAAKKTAPVVKGEKSKSAVAMPAKKVFQKGMGGLTVRVKGSGDKYQNLKVRAFSADNKNSSVFFAAFGTERMQDLTPGTYDIEIETTPAQIYKNVSVSEGKETVQDLGAITGSLNIKALNSKKKDASIPVKVMRQKSNLMAAAVTTNRPLEIAPGAYNIEIETLPHQAKNDVKIEGGKETVLDLGVVSGSLVIKALDENGKDARASVRIKNPADNSAVASTVTNRPIEIGPGEYDVEILSSPFQTKKGVKIVSGEETSVGILIQAPPPQAASKATAPAKKK